MEIIAKRVFNSLYIILDSIFLIVLLIILFKKKKFSTIIFSLFGGILYFIVDFGIFHLLLKTRSIENGNLFGVLLWMSMSYGITNFLLLWIWLSKDSLKKEWTLLIWIWWLCCPLICQLFPNMDKITISRTTSSYHGYMAIFLLISYFVLIIYNIFQSNKNKRFNLPWLLSVGILVQLGWEVALLIGGIRSVGFTFEQKILTLVSNSLLETNLGVPAIFVIYLLYSSKYNEDLSKKAEKLTFIENLENSNSLHI